MPWRETSPMEQRLEFIHEYESGLFTMTELAEQYGISRTTGYKWLSRYESDGLPGLTDRSRCPHSSPQATDPELVAMLVAERRRHPRWGAKKLLGIVRRRDPHRAWPSRSTVCDLLKARGLVTARRRRSRLLERTSALGPITTSNEVWTTDFKGEFRTGDGAYCYPLTLRDGWSRFVLRCDALMSPSYLATRARFERAFADYGLPQRIRSDNGTPFAGVGLGRLSRLSVWWMRLGIVPERIAAGHPEQNGAHEQFHAVLKAETARPPAADAAAQQQRFVRFCAEYNQERPHEALGDEVPASRYTRSPRPLPARLAALEYPSHFEVRLVSTTGYIKWIGANVFLASALAGQYIGLEEIDDGLWTVHFSTVALARYDERHRTLRPIPIAVNGGRSASFAGSAPDQNTKNR
jgi:putative transposase